MAIESFDQNVYMEYLDTKGRYHMLTAAIQQSEQCFTFDMTKTLKDKRRDLALELLALEKLIPEHLRFQAS